MQHKTKCSQKYSKPVVPLGFFFLTNGQPARTVPKKAASGRCKGGGVVSTAASCRKGKQRKLSNTKKQTKPSKAIKHQHFNCKTNVQVAFPEQVPASYLKMIDFEDVHTVFQPLTLFPKENNNVTTKTGALTASDLGIRTCPTQKVRAWPFSGLAILPSPPRFALLPP